MVDRVSLNRVPKVMSTGLVVSLGLEDEFLFYIGSSPQFLLEDSLYICLGMGGIEGQRVSMPGHKVDFRIMDEKQSITDVRSKCPLLSLAGQLSVRRDVGPVKTPCQSPPWVGDLVSL